MPIDDVTFDRMARQQEQMRVELVALRKRYGQLCAAAANAVVAHSEKLDRALAESVGWIGSLLTDEERSDGSAPFLALLDAHDDALCAQKHGGLAARRCVDGLRKLLGVGGFERRRRLDV